MLILLRSLVATLTSIFRFRRAGVLTGHGQLMLVSEEGSVDSPVSFLEVHTSEYTFDLSTMYLRFRWSGEMKTEDPVTAKVLDEWQRSLREATPAVPDEVWNR